MKLLSQTMTPEAHHKELSPLSDPAILLADNRSPEARRLIRGYYEAKAANQLTQVEGCSDARANAGVFIGDPAIEFNPSIAAAGDKNLIKHTIIHQGVKQVMVLQHCDASTVAPGKYPKGCGGLGVKEERVNNNEAAAKEGVYGFVDRRIRHPGIYNQSVISAIEVSKLTTKPVLAGAIDHLTGLIHPFAIIQNGGRTITASVPFDSFGDPFYIYRSGIPDLSPHEIPESFHRVLKHNKTRVSELARKHPDIDKTQKIQDPPAIIMTTSLLPTSSRYPSVFGEPNTNFGISIPFVKVDGRVTELHHEGCDEALAQLEYPISNAVKAQSGHGGHGFHKTHLLIIETPSLQLSKDIGRTISAKPWMNTWLNLPQNQIWVAHVVSGQTKAMEVLR